MYFQLLLANIGNDESITTHEKLTATLWYFATGTIFEDMKFKSILSIVAGRTTSPHTFRFV